MNDPEIQRDRAVRGLQAYLKRRGSPRFFLGCLLVLTGLAGFGISYGLLRLGMDAMWMRYPLSVFGAYGAFLLLMRVWVEIEKLHIHPDDPEVREALEQGTPEPVMRSGRDPGGSWLEWLNFPSFDSIDGEGCLPVILIGVLVALIGLAVAALVGAPLLLAEVLIDVLLAGMLYRRLRHAADENWLGTCIRKTWFFVVCAAALLFIAGICLTVAAPGAKSIGPALERIFYPPQLGSFRSKFQGRC